MSSFSDVKPFSERDNHDYEEVQKFLQAKFHAALTAAQKKRNVFIARSGIPMEKALLDSVPEEFRSALNCNLCLAFLTRDGSLVTINPDHSITSLIWDETDIPSENIYHGVVQALREAIEHPDSVVIKPRAWSRPSSSDADSSKLKAEAKSADKDGSSFPDDHKCASSPECAAKLGAPFSHWAFTPLPSHSVTGFGETGPQRVNDVRRGYSQLLASFRSLAPDVVARAAQTIEKPKIPGASAMRPCATFFAAAQQTAMELGLSLEDENAPVPELASRSIWAAAAHAPPGWTAPKSHAFGTLCELVAQGKSDDDIIRNLNVLFDPYFYQRPQVEPTEQNKERDMEKLKSMGCASALDRRFASMKDVKLLWEQEQPKGKKGKADNGIAVVTGEQLTELWESKYHGKGTGTRGKNAQAPDASGNDAVDSDEPFSGSDGDETAHRPRIDRVHRKPITFPELRTDILPNVRRVWIKAPKHGSFGCVTTALLADAAPIYQWDKEEARNSCDVYVYVGGSRAEDWGLDLSKSQWVPCLGMCMRPAHWADEKAFTHLDPALTLILHGARDVKNTGSALFPGSLKNEFHPYRRTIEDYSGSNKLSPVPKGEVGAAGMQISKNRSNVIKMCVEMNDGKLVQYDVTFERYSDPHGLDF